MPLKSLLIKSTLAFALINLYVDVTPESMTLGFNQASANYIEETVTTAHG